MLTKNQTIKNIAWVIVAGLAISCGACKKKTEDPVATPVTPAKTLNKSTLTNNKTWYNQGSTIVHVLNSNGTCGSSGSWRWVRSSDTMEIDDDGSNVFVKWKFNWNTNTEMECEWIGQGGARTFKTTAW